MINKQAQYTYCLISHEVMATRQIVKLGQVIEYNKRKVFLQTSCRKWGKETSSRPLCFLKKLYMKQKQVVCSLVSIYFGSLQLGIQLNKMF